MPGTERLVTAEEFAHFPRDERYRYELVEGRLVRMSPPNFDHGRVAGQMIHLLKLHQGKRPSGVVVSETGFTLATNPDTVRGPDVSFVRQDRIPTPGTRGFPAMAPDAVFEVLSPDDRRGATRKKIEDYLRHGVHVVVVVDPVDKSLTIHRPGLAAVALREGHDVLDVADVIPGFSCRLSDIFE